MMLTQRRSSGGRGQQGEVAGAFALTGKKDSPESQKKPGISAAWAKILEKYKMSMKEGREASLAKQNVPTVTEQFIIKIPLKRIDAKRLAQLKKASAGKRRPKGEARLSRNKNNSINGAKILSFRKPSKEKKPTASVKSSKRGKIPKLERRQFIISLDEAFTSSPSEQMPRKTQQNRDQNKEDELYLCDSAELQNWQHPKEKPTLPNKTERQLKTLSFCIQLDECPGQKEQPIQEKGADSQIRVLDSPKNQQPAVPEIQVIEDDAPSPATNEEDVQIIKPSEKFPKQVGRATLRDLVSELYLKKFISETLYRQFISHHSLADIRDFLEKFRTGKLHYFDYGRFKFTLLDHRRIVELLVNLFPAEYAVGEVGSAEGEVQNFLEKMYDLSGEEYYRLYTKIDNISKVKWWGKILIVEEERLSSCYKEKRVNQRRAERAEQAVLDVINAFRTKRPDGEDGEVPTKKVKQG